MLAVRNLNIAEFNPVVPLPDEPLLIETADCSEPMERDDGFRITPLDDNTEKYRVDVCVADTSQIYDHPDIFDTAVKKVESKYWDLPNGGRGYDPMIDPNVIRLLDFQQGTLRDAMIVSFVVGRTQPPDHLNISFGQVEVAENLDYRQLSERCRDDEEYRKVGRASLFIMQHLQYNSGGDSDSRPTEAFNAEAVYNRLINGPAHKAWLRGSRLNESLMVCTNHMLGLMLSQEDRPAIYRRHNPTNKDISEFLAHDMAQFSTVPGPHGGLGLPVYTRATSGLRRLEDFMTIRQLWLRSQGKGPTTRDYRDIDFAVRRLNQNICSTELQKPVRMPSVSAFGRRFPIRSMVDVA